MDRLGVPWEPIAKILAVVALIIVANYLVQEIKAALDFELRPSNEETVHRSIMMAAALYTLLLAVPFVPGAEIGLAMIALLGPPISVLVYGCTVMGLSLSFAIGRLMPFSLLVRAAGFLHLHRLSRLLADIEPLKPNEKLAFLTRRAPRRFVPVILRYRYLALALTLNLPGNVIIGGGGGIALIAGLSRMFSIPAFVATIVLAILPVPLAILVFGAAVIAE